MSISNKCRVCGENSGEYPFCFSCNKLRLEGKIIQCEKCGKWYNIYSGCICKKDNIIKCEICNTEMDKRSNFCHKCGNNITEQIARELEKQRSINNTLIKEFKPYIKKRLLSDNEFDVYKRLWGIAAKYNLIVLTKVRMADLIEPNPQCTKNEHYRLFGKIGPKHIDFIMAKKEFLEPLLLIELDDGTHKKAKVIERDEFTKIAYEQAGYTVLHIVNNKEVESEVDNKIIELINRK